MACWVLVILFAIAFVPWSYGYMGATMGVAQQSCDDAKVSPMFFFEVQKYKRVDFSFVRYAVTALFEHTAAEVHYEVLLGSFSKMLAA